MKKALFVLALLLLGTATTETYRSRSRSPRKLQSLRVGDSAQIGGYKSITAEPANSKNPGKVHITHDGENHVITGTQDGMVILKFYDEDGDQVLEKAVRVKEAREDSGGPRVSVGFGFGVGPYYRSDPYYHPFYGWYDPYDPRYRYWYW